MVCGIYLLLGMFYILCTTRFSVCYIVSGVQGFGGISPENFVLPREMCHIFPLFSCHLDFHVHCWEVFFFHLFFSLHIGGYKVTYSTIQGGNAHGSSTPRELLSAHKFC
jgi:hypothetical protein